MKKLYVVAISLITAGLMTPPLAHATNGYFSHGYGMKAKGMAGVGIALPQDSIAAATNPAGMVMVGDRFDLGIDWFKPVRNTELTSATGSAAGTYSGNGKESFLIPEFGYNRMIDSQASVGITVYGHGGMNTSYKTLNAGTSATPSYNFGTGDAGVNLEQLFIAPAWAIKLNAGNAVGVSFHYAYQRFKAEGLQNFGVINPGTDSSSGWGFRLGWIGQVTSRITLGATYQPKTEMSRFSKYAGLFAEQGGFDIPANYGVGISAKIDDATTLAADVQRILYGRVKSIANTGNSTAPLGDADGAGFGWRDMSVLKLGVNHRYKDNFEARAGFSIGKQPIPETETFFNILAPGVVERHLTLGATWTLASKHELTLGYMRAFKKTVTGAGSASGINLNMYQNSFGVAYGRKL